MLRVTDRLMENLISDVLDLDAKEKVGAIEKVIGTQTSHLNCLVKAIQKCGVTSKVWEARDGNGKGTGKVECSSLVGTEKKKVFKGG